MFLTRYAAMPPKSWHVGLRKGLKNDFVGAGLCACPYRPSLMKRSVSQETGGHAVSLDGAFRLQGHWNRKGKWPSMGQGHWPEGI